MGGLYETLSGASGLRAQGRGQQNISNYNAAVAEQEGKSALLESEFDQMRQNKEAEKIKGRVEANLGAAGAAGSPVALDIKREQAQELELENLLIGYKGMVANERAKSQAILDRLQGKLAYQSGKSAARNANVQFGVQLVSLALLSGFGGGTPKPTGGANPTGAGGAGFSVNPTTGMGF